MKSCTQCGTPMPSDSPEGLCARCLLSAAMKDDEAATVDSGATQPALAGGSAPAVAIIDIADAGEVAKHLPQFEILEMLGRGGMGVVYKARQIQLDRIVALKILPPADAASPGFVERFRREARSLARLSHPNIVSIYDFGETNGLYYFVMEFVDGLNLRQMILAHRLTSSEALSIVPKICDALQFAHEEGVVHRDIKPENILIDKRGRVKIADFGLAKLLGRADIDPRLTVSGATLGTPRYMAPEQMDKPETVDRSRPGHSAGSDCVGMRDHRSTHGPGKSRHDYFRLRALTLRSFRLVDDADGGSLPDPDAHICADRRDNLDSAADP
jgi:serine/threonine protein kinase